MLSILSTKALSLQKTHLFDSIRQHSTFLCYILPVYCCAQFVFHSDSYATLCPAIFINLPFFSVPEDWSLT